MEADKHRTQWLTNKIPTFSSDFHFSTLENVFPLFLSLFPHIDQTVTAVNPIWIRSTDTADTSKKFNRSEEEQQVESETEDDEPTINYSAHSNTQPLGNQLVS